jgi:hypothetical protein
LAFFCDEKNPFFAIAMFLVRTQITFYCPTHSFIQDDVSRVARFFLGQYTKTWKNIPNNHKRYQIATKYTKLQSNRPNGSNIYQQLPLQVPLKFTQISIFWFENMPSGNPGCFRGRIFKMRQ